MSYDFSSFKQRLEDTQEWLKERLSNIRTGQANPAILDDVMIESYGSTVPLNQVGNITREDAQTLFIDIWEQENIQKVEKAIMQADLGVNVSSTQDGVRVSFPQLTSESREKLQDTAKEKLEDARIRVRQVREEIWSDIQEQEQEGEITEDQMYRHKDTMEELVDETNDTLEEMYEKKEAQLRS